MGSGVTCYALIGAATGGRSASGFAALAFTSGGDPTEPVVRWGRAAVLAGSLGEMVLDKLPNTPSRLARGPLLGRLACSVVAAGWLAHRRGSLGWRPIAVAAGGCVGGSVAGHAYRAIAVKRGMSPLYAALLEDAAVVLVAAAAVVQPRPVVVPAVPE